MEIRDAAQRGLQFIAEGHRMAAAAAETLDVNALERALGTLQTGELLLRSVMCLVAADILQMPSEATK
jgi:hypothetical protein